MEKALNIDTGWNKSVNVIEKLRHIENSLKINDDNEKSSDDLISAKFKFEALRRQNNNSPEAQSAYEKVLHNFDKLTDRQFLSKIEYINATKKLIEDLSNIKLNNWKSLKETRIDWGLYDSTIALYEWVKKAWIKIYEELKQNLKTLVSPEEWKQIANSLMHALKNPIEFVDNILKWIKEYAGFIYDYINIVMQNSTKKGFATEMSKYLPETWIPLLISSVWPWKFFKILKIEKLLPLKIFKKLETISKVDYFAEKFSVLWNKFRFIIEWWKKLDIKEWIERLRELDKYISIEDLTNTQIRREYIRIVSQDLKEYLKSWAAIWNEEKVLIELNKIRRKFELASKLDDLGNLDKMMLIRMAENWLNSVYKAIWKNI